MQSFRLHTKTTFHDIVYLRSSRSKVFFAIGVLKTFTFLTPFLTEHLCWLLLYLLSMNFEDASLEKNHSLDISLKYIFQSKYKNDRTFCRTKIKNVMQTLEKHQTHTHWITHACEKTTPGVFPRQIRLCNYFTINSVHLT